MNRYDDIMILGIRKCPDCFGGMSFRSPGIIGGMADAGYMGSDIPDKTGACRNPDCRNGWIHERLTDEEYQEHLFRRESEKNSSILGEIFGSLNPWRTRKLKRLLESSEPDEAIDALRGL